MLAPEFLHFKGAITSPNLSYCRIIAHNALILMSDFNGSDRFMSQRHPFSCFLIGGDSLVIQCADMLLSRGHHVLGIISEYSLVKEWASKKHVIYFKNLKEAEKIFDESIFDYLFSVANPHFIPKKVLSRCRKFVVNCHDGMLPRYAGAYVTSWAILNGEKEHGITWHIANDTVDAGDILQQAKFQIDTNETTFSLNLKCYQYSIMLFDKLIDELSANNFNRVAQDISKRTYYSISSRPYGNGLIYWNNSAEDIEKLYRALQFGQYANRFSTAKFMINTNIVIIEKMEVLDKKSTCKPGTVVSVNSQGLQIATQTLDMRIYQVCSIDGQPWNMDYLEKNFGLINGDVLPIIDDSILRLLQEYSEKYAKYEKFWVNTLLKYNPAKMPLLAHAEEKSHERKYTKVADISYENLSLLSIKDICASCNEESTILLALWIIYLFRLGNQNNLGLNISHPQLCNIPKQILSFISNQVPFNINIDSDMTFKDVIKAVSKQLELLQNNHSHLKDLRKRYPELCESPDNADITVIISNGIDEHLSFADFNATVILHISNSNKFLEIAVEKSALVENPDFNTIVNHFAGHLIALAQSIADNPDKLVIDLDLLSKSESREFITEWNATQTNYHRHMSMLGLFELQAKKTPNNIAIQDESASISYMQLSDKINNLAVCLHNMGISSGDKIAIFMKKSMNMIATMFATLKIGAAYVPIDPKYSAFQVQYILDDSNSLLVVCDNFCADELKNSILSKHNKLQTINLDQDLNKFDSFKDKAIKIKYRGDAPAYVLYTSGTTGKPKGVIIKQKGIVNLALAEKDLLGLYEDSKVLQFASIGFDASVWEIYSTLISGAALYVPRHDTILAGHELADYINENQISIITLPPSILNTVKESDLPSLKTLVTAGEPCPQELAMRWCHKVKFINAYGPTETTVCATASIIGQNDKNITIGKPIANTKVYVVDDYLNLLPVGCVGELCVSGSGLAEGYMHQDKLTAEKFIYKTFNSQKREKIYKTGDLVRYLPDGSLLYVGRKDNQVKIRGFRIELEAIQTEILNYQGISQCAVRFQEDGNLNKYLIAYIVSHECKKINNSSIKAYLASRLPSYMIPSLYMQLGAMPLTPNGKIDYKALPLINHQQRNLESEYLAPRNHFEKKLSSIWSNLLNVEAVGVNDDFFELGGESLILTQLMFKLKTEFNLSMNTQAFLNNPTITNLAKILNATKNELSKQTQAYLNDLVLDKTIVLANTSKTKSYKESKAVFITGVTGFVGAHLLCRLFDSVKATYYCLIRSETEEACLSRLRNTLRKYQLNETIADKIVPIKGDFTKPYLGISHDFFNYLADKVDEIYHCGAFVHHIMNYEKLKLTNVHGITNLLKFCIAGNVKVFHYISTLSALSDSSEKNGDITEELVSIGAKHFPYALNGYNQSKWVAEVLLAQASQRRVPIKIYRPGWVIGHSRTGVTTIDDQHLLSLIKGCVQMGFAPDWDMDLHLIPVDYVCELIAKASANAQITYDVFNIVSENTIRWANLVHWLNNYGYPITLISAKNWKENHLARINESNALFTLVPFYLTNEKEILYSDVVKADKAISSIRTEHTVQAMRILGIQNWIIEEKLFRVYFDYLCEVGFLHKPLSVKHDKIEKIYEGA